ncbi:MAG: hypothetical protein AB1645_05830 [Bacillota bacterium]|jgi:hypothetical protein
MDARDIALTWVLAVLLTGVVAGVFLIRRAAAFRPAPRGRLGTEERFAEALEDMRLSGVADPDDLSAQTGAARETGLPPPHLKGRPQTPADMERRRGPRSGR